MIGLDTNILARYYVETTDNDIKTKKQRELSKYIIENSPNLLFPIQSLLSLNGYCVPFVNMICKPL